MNFTRAHDQYLTPPEEPEAVFCEDCGKEMEVKNSSWKTERTIMICNNQFCPAKFEGVAREMADQLVWATDEIKSLAAKIRRLERKQ